MEDVPPPALPAPPLALPPPALTLPAALREAEPPLDKPLLPP
jgi:hypothetical protein